MTEDPHYSAEDPYFVATSYRLTAIERKLDMIIEALKIERRPDVEDLRLTAKKMIERRRLKVVDPASQRGEWRTGMIE